MTPSEAAKKLKTDVANVRRYIRDGRLKATTWESPPPMVGYYYDIAPADLKAFKKTVRPYNKRNGS